MMLNFLLLIRVTVINFVFWICVILKTKQGTFEGHPSSLEGSIVFNIKTKQFLSFKNHLHIWYLCSMLIILHGFPPTKVQGSSMFSAHQRSYGDKLYQFYCQEDWITLRLNLNLKAKLALVINNRSFYLHLKAAATAKKKKTEGKSLGEREQKPKKSKNIEHPKYLYPSSYILPEVE